jgi:hypothetical protein
MYRNLPRLAYIVSPTCRLHSAACPPRANMLRTVERRMQRKPGVFETCERNGHHGRARTAWVLEIVPPTPVNVTAPSTMKTTPPSICARPTQPRSPPSAPHPVRRHPPHRASGPTRITASSPHAPLLRCRISPRRRIARCPWSYRARHLCRRRRCRCQSAHECTMHRRSATAKPALRPIEQRTQSTKHNASHGGALRDDWASPKRRCSVQRCNDAACSTMTLDGHVRHGAQRSARGRNIPHDASGTACTSTAPGRDQVCLHTCAGNLSLLHYNRLFSSI